MIMPEKKILEREDIFSDESNGASFEDFLRRDVRIFQFAGIFSMDSVFSDEAPKPTIWESVVMLTVLIGGTFTTMCGIHTIIIMWKIDPSYSIDCAATMCSGILTIIKGCRIYFCREEFRYLLRLLALMWDDAKDRKRLIEKNDKIAGEAHYVGKLYIIITVFSGISYGLRPYIILLDHHFFKKTANDSYTYNSETIFRTTYPGLTIDTTSKYIICISFEQIAVIYIALYWMASEVMFAQITTHMAIQFRVLCHDLEYVTDTDGDYSSNQEGTFINRLSGISKRHRDLYKHCEKLERIYNPIIFLSMLLLSVNICLCLVSIQMDASTNNWEDVFKSMFQIFNLFLQVVMYCGYSDKLTHQSSSIASAAYQCDWIERSTEFKVCLQIIMMRAQKMFQLTAYGFFLVNLNQVTAIVNTAASYFALLKTMT